MGNQSIFKINSADKSRRFNQYFDFSYWDDLFLKYIILAKIREILFKFVHAHSASRKILDPCQNFINPPNPLEPCNFLTNPCNEVDLYLKTKVHYFSNLFT